MKYEKRLVYVELAGEIDAELCSFCKYGRSMGCDVGTECEHSLGEKVRVTDDMQTDCWAFRPDMDISDIADIVGIILANEWVNWSFSQENGQIKVMGQTKEQEFALL